MKRLITLILILTFIVPTLALADNRCKKCTPELTQEKIKQIKANMSDLGIDKATQDKLVEKLKRGKIWDSMNPEKLSQIPKDALTATFEEPVKTYTFPDGSVIKVEIEIPKDQVEKIKDLKRKIEESGTGYSIVRGVKVSVYYVYIDAKYYADICFVQQGYDEIIRVYNYSIRTLLCGYDSAYLTISKKYESSSGPAKAYLRWRTYVNFGGVCVTSATCYLYLYVGNNRYWSDHDV